MPEQTTRKTQKEAKLPKKVPPPEENVTEALGIIYKVTRQVALNGEQQDKLNQGFIQVKNAINSKRGKCD